MGCLEEQHFSFSYTVFSGSANGTGVSWHLMAITMTWNGYGMVLNGTISYSLLGHRPDLLGGKRSKRAPVSVCGLALEKFDGVDLEDRTSFPQLAKICLRTIQIPFTATRKVLMIHEKQYDACGRQCTSRYVMVYVMTTHTGAGMTHFV